MNPNEALSLGSISQIVMPSDLRQVLAENMAFYLRHYKPGRCSRAARVPLILARQTQNKLRKPACPTNIT